MNRRQAANELVGAAKKLMSAGGYSEFVIWGIPGPDAPGEHDGHETILLGLVEGEPITSRSEAEKYMKILGDKYECRNMRIQEIKFDGTFDWLGEIDLKKK